MTKSASKDTLLCAYAAIGDDALKRDTVVKRLRARIQKLGDLSFNYEEFDADQVDGASVVAACNTVPFASPVRMVVLKNAGKLRKADAESLVAYLQNPSTSSVLLIEAEKLAKSSRLFKAIAAFGPQAFIDCSAPAKRDLPRLVRSMAVGHGITLTEGAARLLIELAGTDTVRLDGELNKIALAHNGADAVNEHEVSSLVARTTEVKPWEFLDALSARNTKRCLLDLTRMPSTSHVYLLTQCVGRIRELICAKSLQRRGEIASLPSVLGKESWKVKHYADWASRFSEDELRRGIVSARDAERAMKSGAKTEDAFKDWLISFVVRTRP